MIAYILQDDLYIFDLKQMREYILLIFIGASIELIF